MVKETDFAWAAGLIDGEGCIRVHVRRNKHNPHYAPSYVLALRVCMCSKCTLERLVEIFACGHVHRAKRSLQRMTPAWQWILATRQAERALRLIRPYMVTKAAEADVALRFCELPTAGNGRYQRVPPELTRARHEMYLQLKSLKSKGRFYDKPESIGHKETMHAITHVTDQGA